MTRIMRGPSRPPSRLRSSRGQEAGGKPRGPSRGRTLQGSEGDEVERPDAEVVDAAALTIDERRGHAAEVVLQAHRNGVAGDRAEAAADVQVGVVVADPDRDGRRLR